VTPQMIDQWRDELDAAENARRRGVRRRWLFVAGVVVGLGFVMWR